jgi:hypothetical protein
MAAATDRLRTRLAERGTTLGHLSLHPLDESDDTQS